MSSSTTSRLGSQNSSKRPSSISTSTAACSDRPQTFCTVPSLPAKSVFQCPSFTLTNVPGVRRTPPKYTPPRILRVGPGAAPSAPTYSPYRLLTRRLQGIPRLCRTFPGRSHRAAHEVPGTVPGLPCPFHQYGRAVGTRTRLLPPPYRGAAPRDGEVLHPSRLSATVVVGDSGRGNAIELVEPEQFRAPVFQPYVHRQVFGAAPAMLYRAAHALKLKPAVPFLDPYGGAGTRFV